MVPNSQMQIQLTPSLKPTTPDNAALCITAAPTQSQPVSQLMCAFWTIFCSVTAISCAQLPPSPPPLLPSYSPPPPFCRSGDSPSFPAKAYSFLSSLCDHIKHQGLNIMYNLMTEWIMNFIPDLWFLTYFSCLQETGKFFFPVSVWVSFHVAVKNQLKEERVYLASFEKGMVMRVTLQPS